MSVVSILAHDYSWYVLRDSYNELLPDAGGEVCIGDNCFIGYKACILKGTTIGKNVIIGAYSVVKGNIPSNTVWAGIPAKMICTLDEFYEKKKGMKIKDAKYRKDHLLKTKGEKIDIKDLGYFSYMFLERTEENYKKYIYNLEFNGIKGSERNKEIFFMTDPIMTFNEFMEL